MTTQRVHDLDLNSIHFHSPTFNLKGQKVVELSFDKDSTAWSNRMTLQLCYDETKPLISNWALGQVREGQDPTKREYELALNKEVEDKLRKNGGNPNENRTNIDKKYRNPGSYFLLKYFLLKHL